MFITYHRLSICNMDKKMVIYVRIKNNQKFQVGYTSNNESNTNKAFREQVKSNLTLKFYKQTMVPIRKVLRKENTCVISCLMFYENIKSIIFNVIGSVVYCIMDNYVCVDSLFLQQAKIYLVNKGFKNTTFNDISVIRIP